MTAYERTLLEFGRGGTDLPGSKVPEVYRNFALGCDDEGAIAKVLKHSAWDVVAIASMYKDRRVSKDRARRVA